MLFFDKNEGTSLTSILAGNLAKSVVNRQDMNSAVYCGRKTRTQTSTSRESANRRIAASIPG